jgi:hypothetical protein
LRNFSSPPNLNVLNRLLTAAVFITAANALLLAFIGSYDLRFGYVHLVAHGLFKPLLYLSGAVLAAMLVRQDGDAPAERWSPRPLWIAFIVGALYFPSIFINPTTNNEWAHQGTSVGIRSLGDLLHLFVWRQPDGFYRPLTFISLWLDQMVFGDWIYGHHLQNIALHAANAWMVVRLGVRLRMDEAAARWAGLIFGVLAVNYEAVLWPGARFDLLAGWFTLAALPGALEYLSQDRVWAGSLLRTLVLFTLGVLSKESAYCFPALFLLFCWTRSRISRCWMALSATALVTLVLIAIRFAIFGGPGGYPDESGVAPHFAIGWKTFASFFTRALPAPLLLINADAAISWYARLAVAGIALWAAVQAATSVGSRRDNATLLAAALLSSLPAANLVDWIGPIAHNVRYLYLTAVWIALLAAHAARARRWLAILAIANALGVVHNLRSFEWIDPGIRPAAFITEPKLLDLERLAQLGSRAGEFVANNDH